MRLFKSKIFDELVREEVGDTVYEVVKALLDPSVDDRLKEEYIEGWEAIFKRYLLKVADPNISEEEKELAKEEMKISRKILFLSFLRKVNEARKAVETEGTL